MQPQQSLHHGPRQGSLNRHPPSLHVLRQNPRKKAPVLLLSLQPSLQRGPPPSLSLSLPPSMPRFPRLRSPPLSRQGGVPPKLPPSMVRSRPENPPLSLESMLLSVPPGMQRLTRGQQRPQPSLTLRLRMSLLRGLPLELNALGLDALTQDALT